MPSTDPPIINRLNQDYHEISVRCGATALLTFHTTPHVADTVGTVVKPWETNAKSPVKLNPGAPFVTLTHLINDDNALTSAGPDTPTTNVKVRAFGLLPSPNEFGMQGTGLHPNTTIAGMPVPTSNYTSRLDQWVPLELIDAGGYEGEFTWDSVVPYYTDGASNPQGFIMSKNVTFLTHGCHSVRVLVTQAAVEGSGAPTSVIAGYFHA